MGPDLASEEQFGPYLVYERLGVGGMATVHRALERGVEGFERCVALKRLLPHLAEDASFIKAFVREAKLASMLAHVNIVQIYELGRVGTEYFISMEYIEGRDVRKILRHARKVTGPAPLHVTVGLMLQLLEALDYAHTKTDDQGQPLGLVHRDVSPSNLLVAPSGHLKVIDFGIAKAQSSTLRTQTGRVKGKLAYMAPEAISGSKDLDARSDVWAAGVILHELLTARPLFASKNEYQTLMKVQRGDIMPPSTFNQACTPELDAIAFKALARDPDDRFANALDMRDELNRVRKQYQLQTSHRDVAMWLDWAFSLEPPAGFSGNTFEPSKLHATPAGRAPTPRPTRNLDDDEAVEMVWGTGEAEDHGHSGPIVLDDVPDVSGKHLAARPETFVTGEEVEVEVISSTGGVGDIPVHQPSHGTAPRGSRPSDRFRAPTPEVVPDFEMSRPRPRTSNPPPTGTARDSSLAMEDLFGLDDIDESGDDAAATLAENHPPIAIGRANTQEPVVRFSSTGKVAIQRAATPTGAPHDEVIELRPAPRTRPGVQPASVRKTAPVSIAPATQKPVIGASMVERNKSGRWWMVLGLLLLAGGGAGAAWYVTSQQPTTATSKPMAPVATGPATVKFDVTPADSEVRIDGTAHTGSPWSTELPAGVHQIEIHRSGYTAYLTSLELAANDKQSLHIELRPLGTTGTTGEATLSVSSTPSGLEAELDGVVLPEHTPIKLPIKPGSHTIVLKKNGAEVWRQTVNAEASSDIELNPSFMAAVSPNVAGAQPVAQPAAHTVRRTATEAFVTDDPVARPDAAAAPQEQPAPVPMPERPVIPTPPTPIPAPPTPAPMPTGPVTVAPNAVTKVSGESPNISRYKSQSLPTVTAAKLCIDTSGNVASVDFVGKLDKRVSTDLADQLKTWKYKPYELRGTAIGACFVVTMRMK
ncbi:MAG: serine/threonine-protein kinase [Deltaproteobacteria bacterium]